MGKYKSNGLITAQITKPLYAEKQKFVPCYSKLS